VSNELKERERETVLNFRERERERERGRPTDSFLSFLSLECGDDSEFKSPQDCRSLKPPSPSATHIFTNKCAQQNTHTPSKES
jgi:hypothetical protein